MDGFVGYVVDFLRDPLAVLQSRSLRQLPPSEPLEIQASHPAELPLLLLRSLRDQPPQRWVLIQLNDTGPPGAAQVPLAGSPTPAQAAVGGSAGDSAGVL